MLGTIVSLVSYRALLYSLMVFVMINIIGMFYYTLANLKPELRSTHRAIQLIACVSCSILAKYGFAPILSPFIKDVNILAKVYSSYSQNYSFMILSITTNLGWIIVDSGWSQHAILWLRTCTGRHSSCT